MKVLIATAYMAVAAQAWLFGLSSVYNAQRRLIENEVEDYNTETETETDGVKHSVGNDESEDISTIEESSEISEGVKKNEVPAVGMSLLTKVVHRSSDREPKRVRKNEDRLKDKAMKKSEAKKAGEEKRANSKLRRNGEKRERRNDNKEIALEFKKANKKKVSLVQMKAKERRDVFKAKRKKLNKERALAKKLARRDLDKEKNKAKAEKAEKVALKVETAKDKRKKQNKLRDDIRWLKSLGRTVVREDETGKKGKVDLETKFMGAGGKRKGISKDEKEISEEGTSETEKDISEDETSEKDDSEEETSEKEKDTSLHTDTCADFCCNKNVLTTKCPDLKKCFKACSYQVEPSKGSLELNGSLILVLHGEKRAKYLACRDDCNAANSKCTEEIAEKCPARPCTKKCGYKLP